jgi:hypothetical protein
MAGHTTTGPPADSGGAVELGTDGCLSAMLKRRWNFASAVVNTADRHRGLTAPDRAHP